MYPDINKWCVNNSDQNFEKIASNNNVKNKFSSRYKPRDSHLNSENFYYI